MDRDGGEPLSRHGNSGHGQARRCGAIRLACAAVTLWFLGAAGALPALAEPAFAVRTGYRCSQCHMNRTGGGLRTSFGSIYAQTVLPRRLLRWREGGNLLPANPDARFAFGGDARFQYVGVRPESGESSSSFEIAEANLYGEARLVPGRLSLYLDAEVGPGGASARELFALFALRKGNSYVKVGKFLPPYGWRLPDDAAFIRQFSGFAYSTPDIGVEFGVEPGKWSFHLAAINGAGASGGNRPNQLTLLTVRRWKKARVGISASNNNAGEFTTTHAGLLAGLNFGRLALLAEGDWVQSSQAAGTDRRWLGFLEADVLVMRGLNIKIAHDWIDPDLDVSTDGRVRDSLGVEYIPYPFIQLRSFVRRRDGPPQVPASRDKQVDFEVHIFF